MFGFIKHLLIPHRGNNHRAKILHNSSIFVLILFLLISSFFINLIKVNHPEVLGVSYSISEQDLLALVNQERQNNNLPALTLNSTLDDAARRKAADMFAKNYWAHFAPDGSTSPWTFIRAAGYNYQFAGENLAKGFTDSPSILSAWMNSPTHRENILSSKYKDVGFAIVEGNLQGEDTVLVVEMFGTLPGEVAAVPQNAVKISEEDNSNPAPTIAVEPTAVIEPTSAPHVMAEVKSAVPTTNVVEKAPKVDSQITTKAAATTGLAFLAFGLVMDMAIVERKKIPRFVGHNIDHLMLILMFILFMILARGGVII